MNPPLLLQSFQSFHGISHFHFPFSKKGNYETQNVHTIVESMNSYTYLLFHQERLSSLIQTMLVLMMNCLGQYRCNHMSEYMLLQMC